MSISACSELWSPQVNQITVHRRLKGPLELGTDQQAIAQVSVQGGRGGRERERDGEREERERGREKEIQQTIKQ